MQPPVGLFVVGAARSGTTSLHYGLQEHPSIAMSRAKEPNYFEARFVKGEDWYAGLFDHATPGQLRGEASPKYSYPGNEGVANRIALYNPRAKIIYTVRNPVQRAVSHYLYNRNIKGTETRSMEDAFDQDPVYLGSSRYDTWLDLYSGLFGRGAVLLVLQDDLRSRPKDTYARIFDFLGVDASFTPPSAASVVNPSIAGEFGWRSKLYHLGSRSRMRHLVESRLSARDRTRLRSTAERVRGRPAPVAVAPDIAG